MPPLALAILESALAAVAAGAILTTFYNHLLSGLRESHLKKAASLLVHPVALGAGIGHFVAIQMEWPRFSLIAVLGGMVVLARVVSLLRQYRLNALWKRRPLSVPTNAIRWSALPAPARAVLQLLQPVNCLGRLELVERELPLRGLHPDMDGFRILFLTDFHVHKWMRPAWFRAVVKQAGELRPDAVLIGGDFVSRRRYCAAAARILDGLQGMPQLHAVRGNHDFWTRPSVFSRLIQRWGGRVLTNEVAMLRRGEGAVALLGLEAPYLPVTARRRADLHDEIASLNMPVLALVHTPQAYAEAAALGARFILAGHTHGGQVRLPFFGTTICSCPGPAEHLWGAGAIGDAETFTSNGVGAFYPLRFDCPPQLVLITLRGA